MELRYQCGAYKSAWLVEQWLELHSRQNVHACVYGLCARVRLRIFTKKNSVVTFYLMSLSFKFCNDPCIHWGDIQLLVTMNILYYILSFRHFLTKIFDFIWTPSNWYFLISSVQWQFLTRRKKNHAILIYTERVRSPRVQTFWWHSSNRDVRPGEFQPYMTKYVQPNGTVTMTMYGIYGLSPCRGSTVKQVRYWFCIFKLFVSKCPN